jgi:hypothetical protein
MAIHVGRAPGATAWRARIEITDAAGVTTARQVEDASCDAVVHASSLLAVLSLAAAPESGHHDIAVPPIGGISAPSVIEDQPRASAGAAVDAARWGAAALALMQSAMAPRMAFGVGLGAFVELAISGSPSVSRPLP